MNADNHLKESLPALTDRIVDSYSHDNRIHHLGHCPLPKYEVIIQIIEDLKDLIYPGFRRREGLHIGNVSYHVGNLIDTLHEKLATQIARALLHADRVSGKAAVDCQEPRNYEAIGQKIAFDFLEKIPELREVLATDVEAAFVGDPSVTNRDEIVFCFPGLEAVTIYRLAHALTKFKVPFIPRMMTEWAHKQTGIDIHPGATIAKHFFIDHGTGVVIGETCDIGQHVRIYQGVTLGALSFATDEDGQLIRGTKRHPTIEDRVIIYANATILGGKTIVGHDSVIGSSVWITSTVAPHTTVVLEKPRLKMRGVVTADPVELDFQI
ncbi:MAG: serine acetyltransferase [Planctomycetota bacterium]|nr:serine acetyltransferase [Planctomycetota bacterium]